MAEPVYFLKLELENVRCFKEKTTLDLSDEKGNWKKWTVILGDNGTGKTTLLQILAACQIEKSVSGSNPNDYYVCPIGFDYFTHEIDNSPEDIPGEAIVYVSDSTETIELGFSNSHYLGSSVQDDERFLNLKCFGYGANRSMSATSLSENSSENSETLFINDAKLINAEEWLLQLDYAASKESNIKEFAQKKREQVKQILISLLPDVDEIRFTTPTKSNLKSTIEFKTPFGWVSIHELSLGYKTMVAWMVDLAARMFERYPDSDNPLAEPAIVLVDEIDLHLHPKWQRKIFDYLSDKFPQTQFIVTAHSPLVVQSAPKDANIVVLRREGDHVVIDNDIKSVQSWRLDQIMSSDLFGIESARDPDTEKWLRERKELLLKKSLTPEEKERLGELNNKVHHLPTADTPEEIEAMELIRKAADYLKNQKA
jgi:energy-coupling factor transporter ATP-binding protein EcfA2